MEPSDLVISVGQMWNSQEEMIGIADFWHRTVPFSILQRMYLLVLSDAIPAIQNTAGYPI